MGGAPFHPHPAKKISIPRIQKPGLALTGDVTNIHPGRVQVLGKSELRYIESLPKRVLDEISEKICARDVACIVVTRNNAPHPSLVKACERHQVALMTTSLLTSTFINRCSRFLDESLAAVTTVHGVLLDVFGVGVLLVGKSGIGKSECALDLVLRGHRLVADDVIKVQKQPPATLVGKGSEIIKFHMEIRGLGIINIRDLFGISAVREQKQVEIVVELHDWDPTMEYDRLGIEERRYALLDVSLPLIQIPVRPGRNISAIIEVAVRNRLLRIEGHHSAHEFQERITQEIMTSQRRRKREKRLEG